MPTFTNHPMYGEMCEQCDAYAGSCDACRYVNIEYICEFYEVK